MTQLISINRALKEENLLDKKIRQNIDEYVFCGTCKAEELKKDDNQDKLKTYQGRLDSVLDSIQRRAKIKSAIILSNAKTKVKINNVEYTIAEIIAMKSLLLDEISLLKKLKHQLLLAENAVSLAKTNAESNLNSYLTSVLGADKNSRKPEEVVKYTEDYYKRKESVVLKPSSMDKAIKELESKIELYQLELDSILTDSNARTDIEI